MRREEETTELIVRQSMEEGPGELSSKNPIVLSCGGIYIPYHRRGLEANFWKILNLADNERLSKVVSGSLPRSPLAEIIDKESKN